MPDLSFLFRLNDATALPALQYEAGLRLIEAADRAGLYGAWITSHHFGSDKGSIASPLLFLAAASQRTRRIRLGAGVVVLTLESPVRTAEDAALADLLANGRIELGVGSGLEDWAFAALDAAWPERHTVFAEKLAALKKALAGEPLTGGRVLHPPGEGLLKRIWRIAAEPDDVRRIAGDGDHLILGTSKKLTLAENRERQFRAIAEFRGLAAPHQRIAISRAIFAHADGDEARRQFEAAIPLEVKARRAAPVHALNSEDAAIVGSPAEIRQAVLADPLFGLVDEILAQVVPAKMNLDQWIASLTLLQDEVFADGNATRADTATVRTA